MIKYLGIILLILFLGCTMSRKAVRIIVLDGTASKIIGGNGSGYIKSLQWKQLTGPTAIITNANSIVALTQITSGTYSWELVGTDNLNNIGKDTFHYKY